jgi:Tol biopolymer transport system component
MTKNRYWITGFLFGLLLVGCSPDQPATLPASSVLSAELPSSLANQNVLFYSMQSSHEFLVTSLDREYRMPLDLQGEYFNLSADGHHLLYTTSLENLDVQVHLLDLSTGEDRVLFGSADIPGGVTDLGIDDPSLSPDGNFVLFQYNALGEDGDSSHSETFGLGIYSLDDGSIETITRTGINSRPEMSPDGNKILTICEGKDAVGFQVCIMERDGGNRQRLTDVPGDHDAWLSPDGMHILYQHTEAKPFGEPVRGLYIMDLDGGNVLQLLDGPLGFLTFGADGSDIVFCRFAGNDDVCEGIYVIDTQGGNLRKLTDFDEQFLSTWR